MATWFSKSEPKKLAEELEAQHWRYRRKSWDKAHGQEESGLISFEAVPQSESSNSRQDSSSRRSPAGLQSFPEVALSELRRVATWSGERPDVEGDVLLCQCKHCRAPMSVRLWLMVAECWQCGAMVQLSPRSQEAVEKWLEEQKSPQPVAAIAPSKPQVVPVPHLPKPVAKVVSPAPAPAVVPKKPAPLAKPDRVATVKPPPIQLVPTEVASLRLQVLRVVRWFEPTAAWMTSLICHLVLFLVLAMLSFEKEGDDRTILLALSVNSHRFEGDLPSLIETDMRAYDAPLPGWIDVDDPDDQKLISESRDVASSIAKPEFEPDFKPQDIDVVKSRIQQPYRTESALLARDVRIRKEVLTQQGGTLLTEAAVARALRWLADHQSVDGSWRLSSRSMSPGEGQLPGRQAGTALALLPFLGAGQTPKSGIYRKVVRNGLDFLLESQLPDGDLRGGAVGEAGMYVHGQAAIVLCEAYAMTKDKTLRKAAEKAIQFICEAQHDEGGWRYAPLEAGDTSVLGWQLMALQSAKMAGIKVDENVLRRAGRYLDRAAVDQAMSVYGYQPGHPPSPAMTAEALLCRIYLGWPKQRKGLQVGLKRLLVQQPPSINDVNYYYWYYATQTFHHVGGEPWRQWNESVSDLLVELQVTEGKQAGSWDPQGPLVEQGGRLYVTCLAACTLEVYYRHLPIFENVQASEGE